MEFDIKIVVTIAILVVIPTIKSEETIDRCDYFTAVPREPEPGYEDYEEDYTGLTWSERPMLPATKRDDVCIENFYASINTQLIYIEEEINEDIVVAKLNYYGSATPQIGTFYIGARSSLNPQIIKGFEGEDDENAWYLVITEKQDYETESNRAYMFNVQIIEASVTYSVLVSISTVNIDDNPPIIQLYGQCIVDELGDPRATDCVYNVTDVDGLISIQPMTFTIVGSRDEATIFTVDEERYVTDNYRMSITLRITLPLDYTESALHVFTLTALDSLPNTHTVTVMVQVQNVEHRDPRWVEIWAIQQFDEKTEQTFSVRAIDGDTGINKQILYKLNSQYSFFSIDQTTGTFHVDKIDRDTLEQEVFQLQIVAYKFDNQSYFTESDVIIVVNDVNDQYPEALYELYEVDILEETPMTITFDQDFGFHDRDLGLNAQYEVYLESVTPVEAASAFSVAPNQGYQRTTFIMNVAQYAKLDYEEQDWQNIELLIVAKEMYEASHLRYAVVKVNLINWNDEVPIFEQDNYEVEFLETVGAGYHVATVMATDRDIDDKVIHTILGNAASYLHIDEETGNITVTIDNAFNYLRQDQIIVQVRATDTLGDGPYNTATTQLTINLIDVNNNPPTIGLPINPPTVEENVPEDYLITDTIVGSDPDSSADIYFEIDWDTSYATKQGRQVDPIEYVGCVVIETIFDDETIRGSATGRIEVREIKDGVTIDFEKFEVLYISIKLTDLNQEIGDDSTRSTFTIIIEDMNDNWPIWNTDSIASNFLVRERSSTGVVVGSVYATDIDGPVYNQIRYYISPAEDTPDDLIAIDISTGQLSVLTNEGIDADVPPRYNLTYTITASDCCVEDCPPPDPTCWRTDAQISISITDTNNKVPSALQDEYESVVYIFEDAQTGDEVQLLISEDEDRDEMYNSVYYQINYAVNPTLREFFAVDGPTGLIYVDYTSDTVLDRDRGQDTHTIFLTIYDNFYSQGDGNRNQADINVTVILLDVNDNAPELPSPSELSWSISESLTEGSLLSPTVYAPDIDEPNTDNSHVNYDILDLMISDRDIEIPHLFDINNVENITGDVYCKQDLKGYWGTYSIIIQAYDLGIPQQSSNETYEIVVRPYNYMNPVFVYPTDGLTVRLAKERALVNGLLSLTNFEYMPRIEATDDDGLEAGVVTFQITGDANAVEYFTILNDGTNSGTLVLQQMITEENLDFQITITATDQGTEPNKLSTSITFNAIFVATQGDPVYSVSTQTVSFSENETGLEETQELLAAEDPKNLNCVDDCHDIYYYIIGGNTEEHFSLDSVSNILSVIKPLDRSEYTQHTITVAASNSAVGPEAISNSASILSVTIRVREMNPRPQFERELYTAGISTTDTINKELLTITATHSEALSISYSIDYDSIIPDDTMASVANSAVLLDSNSGVLTLNIQPTASMRGLLSFTAMATDSAGETGRTEVKIYVVSSENRVYFKFVNTLTKVEAESQYIADTFSSVFNMICNIDQIVPGSDDSGAALEDVTEVRTHFIQDDIVVEATVIENQKSDSFLLRNLQSELLSRYLFMEDILTETSNTSTSNNSTERVKIILIIINVILAIMCGLLLMAYYLKTKRLNRRLEALSTTKFGSQDSGLNRAGIMSVPGTNKHAVEGSNPIWNEEIKAPDFDALSNASDDSDLIGIEEDPQFNYDYFPSNGDRHDFENKLKHQVENVASHTNRFNMNNNRFKDSHIKENIENNRY